MPQDLNQAQRRAVETTEGPLLVIAGPGTGKTKTLTTRIAHLLKNGDARPHQILALTFTNKAAAEMRERVSGIVSGDMPVITTFHALCYQLLSQGSEREIRFVSDHERMMIIKQLRTSTKLKGMSTGELALELSRLKNRPSDSTDETPLTSLLKAYNETLEQRGLHDFDDLLTKTRDLLAKRKLQLPYNYILVDEFQDTNLLQYELLDLLRNNDNVCVIGDPLQSIYGFRGADSTMFDHFTDTFPDAQKVTLTTNYRSTSEIVELTNSLFSQAPRLQAHTTAKGEVRAVEVLNEYSEATWIIDTIEKAIGGSSFLRTHQMDYAHSETLQTFRNFAILYRTHHVGKVVKRMLSESGIPFQIAGEGSIYEQPAIWAVIELLRYLNDPTQEHEAALEMLAALKDVSKTQRRVLLDTIDRTRPLSQLAAHIMESFGLNSDDRSQLIGSLIRFDAQGPAVYIRHIDELMSTNFYDPLADAVTLTTIHAAKGLEFDTVFLIAGEEGIMPHERRGGTTDLAEERRLFYVAVSRARRNLNIMYARNRAGKPQTPSRFITELDPQVLPRHQDEAMVTQKRRLEKRKAKRSQGTLFDL